MRCIIKSSLLKDYRDYTAGYVKAVKRMKDSASDLSQSDFSSIQQLAKDCDEKAKNAKRLLQRHMQEHHC